MRYPAWKYLLILVVLVVSTLYALPSLYPDEPAVQISGAKAGTQIDQTVVQKAEQILKLPTLAVMIIVSPIMRLYYVWTQLSHS